MRVLENWLKISLFNLGLVALLGVTLRYKIAFTFRLIDQKNMMHAHSHFAFSGWVTQALMVLLLYYLHTKQQDNLIKRYKWVLLANLLTAYGMLVTFPVLGYTFWPILFSTLSIFVSYAFAVMLWSDLNKLPVKRVAHRWFKASLIWSVISSIGPFSLAYMMASHHLNQKYYLGSVYTFLHFQYNGWFLFACMGLFFAKFEDSFAKKNQLNMIYLLFAISCIPSLLLSMPWLTLSDGLEILTDLLSALQLIGWIWLIRIVFLQQSFRQITASSTARLLMILAAISFSIKLVLQLCSSYHPLSELVFGYRPIVIGYLHLIFLGIISVFILGYMLSEKLIEGKKNMVRAIVILIAGIFIQEIFLMLQGTLALLNISIPDINIYLLLAAAIIFSGILAVNILQFRAQRTTEHPDL